MSDFWVCLQQRGADEESMELEDEEDQYFLPLALRVMESVHDLGIHCVSDH